MAIYKSSLHSPNLEEVDLSQNNTFSCMVNTSGEPIRAYKMQILSGRGDEKIYGPEAPISLSKPVKNKNVLKIDGISSSMSGLDGSFENGKDYQWGVRVYNQVPNATTQPNTLVCDGFLVGSTKYVIWCQIPDQTEANKNAVDQIVYDRYIEFDTTSANMRKGAKDDVSVKLPDTLRERRKIDWVTKEVGYNKNIVKIETTDNFSFNYIDGTPFKIFQCSDEHTLKSFFVDPNSNINVSDYVVLFKSAADAKAAHDVGYKPSLTEISGDADPEGDTTPHIAENIFGTPQKVIGYSSDTGEIRLGKSYLVEPENGYAYLIFEYDSINKVCTEISPIIEEDAEQAIKDNPYLTQVVGGREINNSLYKVMTNRWDSTAKRLFIQPNINIKSDETNPNELVFDDGTRVDIKKQYWTNTEGDKPVEVDITFDKLDNTQWLLTTDSGGLNESGQVPSTVSGTPPIIPQTDYKVYTDFMDSMPFNVFYARTAPVMEIQYRDLNKQEKMEKEGEEDEPFVYFNGVRFEEDLREFFLEDRVYQTLTEDYIISDNYPMSLKDDGYFPSISNNDYYNSILEMVGSYASELVIRYQNAPNSIIDQDIEAEIELLYQHYNSVGIPLRNIQFNTEFAAENGQGIKYYHYYLYAYKDQVPELIAQSEDLYSTELIWNYRGFLSGTKYNIKVSVIDEYDKEFIQSMDFNIFYGTEKSSAPLGVEFDCEKKAIKVTATSPEYVVPTLPNLIYLSSEDKSKVGKSIFMDVGQICYILEDGSYEVWNGKSFEPSELKAITEDNIYSDENSIFDDYVEVTKDNQLYYDTVLDDSFPNTKIQIPVNFSLLTQFQITDQFIDQIPFTSENKKLKIAGLGYEYFNADKYKVEGISVGDIVVEEVKHILPVQSKIGDVRYLIYSSNEEIKDGYYFYTIDTDPNSKTFGVSSWVKMLSVEGTLPDDTTEILNTYKNYCLLTNSSKPEIENGCYQYIDAEWVYLPELTPEKNEKDYLDAIADVFVLSDGVESTPNVEYQWLNEAWVKINTYTNENAIKNAALNGEDSKTIYKMNGKYYNCIVTTVEVNKEEKRIATLTDITNAIIITVCDKVLPVPRYIYRFEKEMTYGNISYSIGNYLWNGYIFVNTVVEEVLDISNATFLEGVYYYFPVALNSNFSAELNDYFVDSKQYQNVTSEGDLIEYFISLRDGRVYQKELLTDIYNATIEIQGMTEVSTEEIADAISNYVYIINNKYNEIPMYPNKEQKGTYYDGNYYHGYYLWEDGSNNEFRSLYLFLNNCKGFSYEDGILIKNDKRCYLELYDVENPDSNTEPLTCFVTGEATNGSEIISDHINLLTLGGNIPAPEKYKYAIQDNLNNEYQFANTLGSGPREGEKYRVYSLGEKELASLLEDGTGLPPTEDAAGNPYGVYTWNNEYNKWIIEPTDYGYIENVKDLVGYGLKGSAGQSYDNMTTEERYDYLSVPENCRSRIGKEEEITIVYKDKEIIASPDNTSTFSDPLAVISEDGSVVITDANNKEDNWNFSVFANASNGNTGVITTKKAGDLLWTDGNEIVISSLPTNPKDGVVYQLTQSTDKDHPDGYYRYASGVWGVNYDRYYYKTVDGVEGYYIWESWYDEVENKEKVAYTRLLNGTPNARNVWIDNSAYSYNQLIAVINRIWLTMYLTVTYNETNPVRCIIKAQDKWEG